MRPTTTKFFIGFPDFATFITTALHADHLQLKVMKWNYWLSNHFTVWCILKDNRLNYR